MRSHLGARRGPRVADPTNFLTLFEHKIRDQAKLSESETNAIVAFLSLNVAEFKKLARFGGVAETHRRWAPGGGD